MYLSLVENWKYGLNFKQRKNSHPIVQPSFLENLRCHSTDEYLVINTEDDSPIPPLACSFSKLSNSSHVLALVDENGSLVLYNTNQAGENALLTDWIAHNNAIFDVEWSGTADQLLTASGDQTVCLWDVPTETKLLTFRGHTSSVRSVKFRPQDGAVFASGSRDGHVRIWDSRCNVKEGRVSCIGLIKNAHTVAQQAASKRKKPRQGLSATQDSQQSVTCVLFQNDNLLATSGAVDGCVKVWDTRKLKPDSSSPVYMFPYTGTSKRTHGYSSLVFDSYHSRLYASCTDDVIYTYDFTTYNAQPVCTYRGHRNTSFYVKAALSPDNQFLLSGSTDEHAYIWQVSKPNSSPVILKGHRSEISDVAWCKTDLFRIVTTSDDNTMRIWRYDPTVPERNRLGRPDSACDIVGTAERTHRDIGTSFEAPQTPKRSPSVALKRSSTMPFGPVTEVTPKRARTALASTPSPSIKMWLKRSASDPSVSGACGSNEPSTSASELTSSTNSQSSEVDKGSNMTKTNKVLKTIPEENTENKSERQHSENSAKNDLRENCSSKSVENANKVCADVNSKASSPKRRKLEFTDENSGDSRIHAERKSCKRKLSEIDSEKSPSKQSQKRQKNDSEIFADSVLDDNKLVPLSDICLQQSKSPSKSPGKKMTPLKDLDSEINKSPVKLSGLNVENIDTFASPARRRMAEWSNENYLSPTANLPNLVVDGPSTNQNAATVVCKKPSVDWLTQMRIQKNLITQQSPQGKVRVEETVAKSSAVLMSPKVKASLQGTKSITSFFQRQASKT